MSSVGRAVLDEVRYLWAYGLVLALPARVQALRAVPPKGRVDITVSYGGVPPALSKVVSREDVAEIKGYREIDFEGRVLWVTQRTRYLIEDGRMVVVHRDGAEPAGMRFVVAFALPAILMQRGTLVLHATTVAADGAALCITGESGAGKSTLAATLMQRGLRLVSDDVTALDLDASAATHALPGLRRYSLHEETHDRIQAPTTRTWRIPGPRGKVALWAPPEYCVDEPRRLAAIVSLKHGPPGSAVKVTPLNGVAKAQAVLGNAYLPILLTLRPDGFPVLPKLLSDIPIIEVQRPPDTWTVDELADWALTLLEE